MNFNCDHLRMIRHVFNFTQKEVSERLQIPQGKYSRIEMGNVLPSDHEVSKLASIFSVHPKFFFEKQTNVITVDYRKRQSVQARDRYAIEGLGKYLTLRIQQLLVATDTVIKSKYVLPVNDPVDNPISPVEAARLVRSQVGIADAPIRDLYKLVESFGVFVIELDFRKFASGHMVDGFTLRGDVLVVILNEALPLDRKRFTLAHELGHIVLHAFGTPSYGEDEANLFAAELLMPSAQIRHDLLGATLNDLRGLKVKWRVSIKSLIYRMSLLDLISESRLRSFYKQYSSRGWSQGEPMPLSGEKPELLTSLLNHFVKDHGYVVDDLFEMMNTIPSNSFAQIFDITPTQTLPQNVYKLA